MSLSAVSAFPIDEKVKKEYQQANTKLPQNINRTGTLSMSMSVSVGLFERTCSKNYCDI